MHAPICSSWQSPRQTGPNAEAFVFATRLTRLTRALSSRNPERAIERAAAAAPDWSSGTRIGDSLREFNDRHGRRGMARGAVIVILSDGWERGDPQLVGREMQRLARLAHRIVWVNPRAGSDAFSVQSGGMVAALPFCDALVSGHSFHALGEVAEAIGAASWDDRPAARWKPRRATDDGVAVRRVWPRHVRRLPPDMSQRTVGLSGKTHSRHGFVSACVSAVPTWYSRLFEGLVKGGAGAARFRQTRYADSRRSPGERAPRIQAQRLAWAGVHLKASRTSSIGRRASSWHAFRAHP